MQINTYKVSIRTGAKPYVYLQQADTLVDAATMAAKRIASEVALAGAELMRVERVTVKN